MDQKTILVTGATGGIGWETSRQLAQLGERVVLVGREPARADAALAKIRSAVPGANVEALLADLGSQQEVRHLAGTILERYPRLDVLINNVGAMFWSRSETVDGIEQTFALNYLNVFLLTNLLLDRLKASAPARIVNVASDAHQGAHLNLSDLQGKRSYRGMRSYGQSKLAVILWTYELARRLEGTGVTVNALHPGVVASNIGRNNGWLFRLAMPIVGLFSISLEEGARTSVYLATAPEVEGVTGKYFVKSRPSPSSKETYDQETGQKLCELSERLVG